MEINENIIDQEISVAKALLNKVNKTDFEDFNIRGKLYKMADMLAPDARQQDINYMQKWLKPVYGEKGIDIAAGSGFLTFHLAQWTQANTYAVDSSEIQLNELNKHKNSLPIFTIKSSLIDTTTLSLLGTDAGSLDYATSFAGIHHILDTRDSQNKLLNNQHSMIKRVNGLLKPSGRFVGADVGGNTTLARHFEESVKKHCITGHKEKWLTEERLQDELIKDTNFKFIKAEIINIGMVFESTYQMGLYMKCLHAYDLPVDLIIQELNSTLGYSTISGKIHLNWPLLFFHLQKQNP